MMNTDWLFRMDEMGETPLSRVSKSGRMELANVMLTQDIDDHIRYAGHLPAMHRAAYWDYGDAIEDLLEEGDDPMAENANGETPLHLALRLGNRRAVEALVESGMDVNVRNAEGMTALHWAALNGRTDLASLLLEHGADPHAREWVSGGVTPLDMARAMGYRALAETLELENLYAYV